LTIRCWIFIEPKGPASDFTLNLSQKYTKKSFSGLHI
jgi:hypothetical protein